MFSGVCGGLGAALRLDAWIVRGVWAVLTVLSSGLFAVTYATLWWLTPQESLIARRRRFPTIMALLLIALTAAAWWARDNGQLQTAAGVDLTLPGVALFLSAIFFLRQLGGRA